MIKIIYGNVNADGSIKSGEGFDVVHDKTGQYTIVFGAHFTSVPAVVTLQNYPGWDDFHSDGGCTFDNTVLIAVNVEKCKVKTGDAEGKGNACDRNFTFIAIGD